MHRTFSSSWKHLCNSSYVKSIQRVPTTFGISCVRHNSTYPSKISMYTYFITAWSNQFWACLQKYFKVCSWLPIFLMASQKAEQIPKILTGVSAVWVLDSNYALQVWTTRSVCSVLKAFPVSKFNSETSFLFQGEFKFHSLFATSSTIHGEVVKTEYSEYVLILKFSWDCKIST